MNKKSIVIIIGLVFVVITFFTIFNTQNSTKDVELTNGGDLTIMKSDITNKIKIYPYQSNDIYMEVMAVSASDGTIRTALNTCINCYNSGRGYYTQQGDMLICQSCGNQFEVDQIEIIEGGCNPVPIAKDIKTEDKEKIIIHEDSLVEYEPLFEEWKK